ncbi:uncharacterized protein MONBRDRAFT_24341 [Monosiga brevicollis MX1]|uniref:Uncharacterized protein n=1 Tax=Monosiga brevicollis TaxID=81824 RepID=A9UW46_MONBE|nr:uncharacterized protein MONBRDRAFT_24341 [Monosiga brevicollis MX1]EDQ90498.1 predicted protein [Monosiga brevicollis MX1]|eukprot:XP_001744549.1 hypothetical protein [Monosiga brevicollis MX1]
MAGLRLFLIVSNVLAFLLASGLPFTPWRQVAGSSCAVHAAPAYILGDNGLYSVTLWIGDFCDGTLAGVSSVCSKFQATVALCSLIVTFELPPPTSCYVIDTPSSRGFTNHPGMTLPILVILVSVVSICFATILAQRACKKHRDQDLNMNVPGVTRPVSQPSKPPSSVMYHPDQSAWSPPQTNLAFQPTPASQPQVTGQSDAQPQLHANTQQQQFWQQQQTSVASSVGTNRSNPGSFAVTLWQPIAASQPRATASGSTLPSQHVPVSGTDPAQYHARQATSFAAMPDPSAAPNSSEA